MKYRDNEPKVDAGLAASLKALRERSPFFTTAHNHINSAVPLFAELPAEVVNTAEVIQLDAHRPDPHIVLIAPGKAHVIPEAYIADIVARKVHPDNIDPDLICDVFGDWLKRVNLDKDDGK